MAVGYLADEALFYMQCNASVALKLTKDKTSKNRANKISKHIIKHIFSKDAYNQAVTNQARFHSAF